MSRVLAVTVALLLAVAGHSHGAPSQCEAVAGNLIANCGFENGFTSWNRASPVNPFLDSTNAHTGQFAATFMNAAVLALGPNAADDEEPLAPIGQSIVTVPGQTYALTFFLDSSAANESLASAADYVGSSFVVAANNVPIFTLENLGPFAYTSHTVLLAPTGTTTMLTFSGFVQPGSICLDDITVTAVPEPAVLTVLALGLAGLSLRRMKRGQRSD